jgi:hypothetical protein
MRFHNKVDFSLWLAVIALAGWVVPGGGHFLIRQPRRATIIFVTIILTFGVGLYVGSIGVVDSIGGWAWYIAQMMVTPAVWILDHIVRHGSYHTFGHPCDLGQIYTAVAGLLNLLSIFSAIYMAYAGRGEFIGQEE